MKLTIDQKLEAIKCTGYRLLERKAERWQETFTFNCHGAPKKENGKYYCLVHSQNEKKAAEFKMVIEDQLDRGNYNFCGYWFPEHFDFSRKTIGRYIEPDFRVTTFNKGASFQHTVFLGGARFDDARFKDQADFNRTIFAFGNAYFSQARFPHSSLSFRKAYFNRDAFFNKAQFSGPVYFNEATFICNAAFANAEFGKPIFFDQTEFMNNGIVNFYQARFRDLAQFKDLKISDSVEFYFGAIFERPELVFFHSSFDLNPRWFIDTDVRKFNFETIDFSSDSVSQELDKTNILLERIKTELGVNMHFKSIRPHDLLITAYRRLAVNAEDNNRYHKAMQFRYMAMDLRRQASWKRWPPLILHWLYWISSGYSEKVLRATIILFLIWFIPFSFYVSPFSTFHRTVASNKTSEIGDDLRIYEYGRPPEADLPALSSDSYADFRDAIFYSFNVMALQKPEPKPANDSWRTRLVITFQTILGPVQATLLLLAIRRKFMR
jgi:Pentapeptide repeats (9 copies)